VGALILGLFFALVAATAALAASCLRLRSAVGFLLAVFLVASAEIVVVSLGLSTVRALTRGALLASIVALLAVAVVTWVRCGRPSPPLGDVVPAARDALSDRAVAVLAALAIVTHLYLLAGALTVPQSSPDTLLYHLPRAALWKQQHAVAYVADSPDERVDAAPPNAEIEIAVSMILSGSDRYAPLVQLIAVLATCAAIFGIARRLGLDLREAAFGAAAYSTFTLVALQTPTALNDLALAAPLVAAAYFAIGRSRAELVLAALALAVAVGTKLTAVLALPVLAAFVLSARPRPRLPALALAGSAGLAAGSVWYVVNLAETRKLDGGLADAFPQFPHRSAGATVDRIGLLFKDLLELSGAEGEGWLWAPAIGIVPGALALVLAVALLASGRRQAAAVTALLGASLAVVLPTLATWTEVATGGARQLLVIVGVADTAPGTRVPIELYESSIHSAYGIAFVVLFIWVGALVSREVAHRRLPAAALVAIVSVPLFVVILALAIEYDPLRMRFAAFPVALAAAVLGVALRVRPLAWAAVALTAGTLAVSIGYFASRPAGLSLLPENRGQDRAARWFVQGEGGNGDPEAFRYLERELPADATVALAVVRNTYLYPAWDAGLHRTVLFVPESGIVPGEAEWLVVGPTRVVDDEGLAAAGWMLELDSEGGWRIFRS
jgi:hypothetical protein